MLTPPRKLPLYAIALLLLIAATGCGSDEEAANPGTNSANIPSVEVIQARYGALPLVERMTGLVRAANQVTIYSEITAPVVRVVAQNGDNVRRGDPLVYLNDKQYSDQLRQVEAALQIAEADARRTEATLAEVKTRFARVQQLADKQLQSAQELEALQAQVSIAEATHAQSVARIAQAEANVEEQKETLRKTVVRAPVSGFVGLKNAEVGMRVDPNTPLYTIGSFEKVLVEISVTDEMINRIKNGDPVQIVMENDRSEPINAHITRISPFLEAGSYSATAEIEIDNQEGKLRPGMFVAVDVFYGESTQATLIPESALYENPNSGLLGVYVAPSLKTETPIEEPETYDPENPPPLTEPTPMTFKPVEVLARGRGVAGVRGVELGDWVITVGQNLIRNLDGQGQARARPVSWDRVVTLQELQDHDLLIQFMDKQQQLARRAFQTPDTQIDSSTAGSGATR